MSRRILLALICLVLAFTFATSVTQASPSLAWTVPMPAGHPNADPYPITMRVAYGVTPQYIRVEYGVGMWIYQYGAATPFSTFQYPEFWGPAFAADFDGDGHMEIAFFFGNTGSVGVFDVVSQQIDWLWMETGNTRYDICWSCEQPVDYTGEGRAELALFYHYSDDNWETETTETRIYTFSAEGTALVGDPPTQPEMITAYPNPTHGSIQFGGLEKQGGTFSVFDAGGRQVHKPQEIRETQNIGGLPPGAYFVRVITPNGNKVNRRIVLQ